ncbi:hypothetical protein C1I95_23665 [Micromonospora craterilacus]|uniref:Uncharacterized protein n=1 Tax=Micromonospora craterilacus TaxID=1655439 RepID=A0A2W2FD80_9ACTN|nr:hypothetical protein C1I95_23665 [Micromonospora craterilacus]
MRAKQILELPQMATADGMEAAEIAAAIGCDECNIYRVLRLMELHRLLESTGVKPRRWRLSARLHTMGAVYVRLASRLRPGEWTTSGDISIAARGDTRAATAISDAVRAAPSFPHPERILLDGGRIDPTGRHGRDGGIDRCRELLEQQGVRFAGEAADPAQRVLWDELRRRDEAAGHA